RIRARLYLGARGERNRRAPNEGRAVRRLTPVQILVRSHNANVAATIQQKAEQAIAKIARRLRRTVDAHVVFASDGPTRRVEIVLHAPRRRSLVAEGTARQYGTALDRALEHLATQTTRAKRVAKERARRVAKK
ncbi:MAG: HPF/RaiA family ribosome-associated protein, partial [Gemmatimonadaceae bacterium]